MFRNLIVDVDCPSWGTNPVPPSFVSRVESVNVSEVLLAIGIVTAPPIPTGFSLSEFWAWLRYFKAISPSNDLALVPGYHDLDPHQKTILSDDFGMGFSMRWAWEKLNIEYLCDGKYFVDHYLSGVGGTQAKKPGKRGPSKCPDFICLEGSKFHIVECKGTQSGSRYSKTQMESAKVQKASISFPSHCAGESLACGLEIAFQDSKEKSRLRVADPVGDALLKVSDPNLNFARETILRGMAARLLTLSGFPLTASTLAEPNIELFARSRPTASRQSGANWVEMDTLRRTNSRKELSERTTRDQIRVGSNIYTGLERKFEFSEPIGLDRGDIRSVVVRMGFNEHVLGDLDPDQFSETIGAAIRDTRTDFRTGSDGDAAQISLGQLFHSEVMFQI